VKKINILQMVTGLGVGGAEKSVLNLAKHTSKTSFNTFVVSMSKRDELLSEFLENHINITLLKGSRSIQGFVTIVKEVNKFVKKNNIQIIHAHMTHSIIISSIIRLFNPSIKIVYTSHSLNIGSKLREFIVYSLKQLRDVDIVFSKDLLKFFYKKNYQVVPNGIEIDNYNLKLNKNKKFTFVVVGRLETVKNHKFLIEMANNLKDKYNFELQIAGDGYLKEELNSLISKYNLEDNVKLLGLRSDIPKLLSQSHCLLMSSLWEGLPIVILEAGASSLPVISTAVGGIPSLLNDKNAYLADFGNFQNKMIEVLEYYKEAEIKGKYLFNDISKKYSIDSVVRQHENIYKELI
jgi:glycosyltransferase involved in cell wall biosynthesis